MYVIATIIVFKHFNITLCYYIFTLLRMSESNTFAQEFLRTARLLRFYGILQKLIVRRRP